MSSNTDGQPMPVLLLQRMPHVVSLCVRPSTTGNGVLEAGQDGATLFSDKLAYNVSICLQAMRSTLHPGTAQLTQECRCACYDVWR